jgi:tRNA modification GTPase
VKAHPHDTIVAVSTPHGRGAIGIVRLSGRRALEIAGRLTRGAPGSPIEESATHTLKQRRLFGGGVLLDEALVAVMRGPGSYTGEDVVEFHCHGNPLVLSRVLEACLREGARIALPGEFTRRAFLNGRMDLAQAEAVAGIIEAESGKALEMALRQADGALSRRIEKFREELLDLLADLEARIEFPEDVPADRGGDIRSGLVRAKERCRLLDAARAAGMRAREGARVVIVGKPNAGKSCLFNALLHADRALVTSQRGTTRDTVEETVELDGISVTFVDTAGICGDHLDEAGRAGVARSKAALERADLALFVADSSVPWTEEDRAIAALLEEKSVLLVLNKSDLERRLDAGRLPAEVSGWRSLSVSAKMWQGIDSIRSAVIEYYKLQYDTSGSETAILFSAQQSESLKQCAEAIVSALDLSRSGNQEELVAVELNRALGALGDIVGEKAGEELLDRIFSRFCIGK